MRRAQEPKMATRLILTTDAERDTGWLAERTVNGPAHNKFQYMATEICSPRESEVFKRGHLHSPRSISD